MKIVFWHSIAAMILALISAGIFNTSAMFVLIPMLIAIIFGGIDIILEARDYK